jgi:hypothetical protein
MPCVYTAVALHAVAQVPPPLADVVTLSAELALEVPAASVASTVKLYVVEAANPLTANDVPLAVPIEVPFCNTV